jgi:hypothetical protein
MDKKGDPNSKITRGEKIAKGSTVMPPNFYIEALIPM